MYAWLKRRRPMGCMAQKEKANGRDQNKTKRTERAAKAAAEAEKLLLQVSLWPEWWW